MLLDLLSSSNQISFNIKVAQLFGLKEAVYLSELMVINEKAIRKDKIEEIDGMKFFTVSRSYITNMTTLSAAEQREIEKTLNKAGVLKILVDKPDTLFLDIDTLGVLIGGDLDKSVINNIKKIAAKKTPEETREAKYAALKIKCLNALKTTNIEKRTAYANWIEAALTRYGGKKFNANIVRLCEQQVDDFAGDNTKLAVAIITDNACGYNTMQYSIDKYKELHPAAIPQKAIDKPAFVMGSEVF